MATKRQTASIGVAQATSVFHAVRFATEGERALHFLPVNKPGGVTKYALKGVNPAYATYFHMRARDQGTVSGRRVAISRSIGRAARHRAGWKRKKTKAK